MVTLTTWRSMKQVLRQGMLAVALAALMGFQITGAAAQEPGLWSIVIHFEYQNGFEFDYVLQRGVSTQNLADALAECGRSHSTGSVVRYYCYPVAE